MDNRAVAGAQLEEWLELQETVKSALAEYAGVSPSTVSRWIAGRTRPTGDRLALVALLLSGQAVLKTAPGLLHAVVDLRELVDWVHLYDYCAQDLREALVAVQESYNIRCTLLDKDGELKGWPFPPLVSIEAQGAFLPEIHLSRAQEVEQIRRALFSFKAFREPLHRRVALWGMGGIGKTFLAKTIAMDDDVREHFWDGVLWAELGPEPGQVEQKAARWLPRWGDLLKLDLPADATTWEWQAAIRDKLRHPDRRLLIILDDVWWSEDVEPFIVAGSQSQILLTTRNRAVAARIPDSELLEVPPLSHEESHILLHEWSGAERRREDSNGEYAVELTEVLEAHPLALSLVGSLVKQQGWAYVLRRLRSHLPRLGALSTSASATRHASVELALELSYRALSEALQVRFRQLGVFPYGSDFASTALVGLWSFGEEGQDLPDSIARAEDTLRDFDDRALLMLTQQQGEERRFRLHSLLHDYARGQLREMGEWVQIQRQYVAVYTKMAQWLGVDFTRYPGAMEAEWSNLTAAFDMALEQEQYGEAAFQLACLVPYMMSKGWIGEIDHRYERLKPYHDELPAEIRGHLDRSQVQRYSATGDWRTAHRFNERVFANERITAEVRAFALLDESRIRYVMGDLEGAAESLRKSSEIGARLKSPFLQAENLMARADVLEAQGYTEAALACWSDLAEMSAAAGNSVQTAVALREAARLSVVLGRLEVARQLLRQALENAYGGASPVVECAALSELGELLLALDEPEDIEFIGRRMLVLLEEMAPEERETERRKGIAMGLLARAAKRLGRLDEALDRAREMVGLFERSQAGPRSLAYAWWLMYETQVSRGEIEEASQALSEAERLWPGGDAPEEDRQAEG